MGLLFANSSARQRQRPGAGDSTQGFTPPCRPGRTTGSRVLKLTRHWAPGVQPRRHTLSAIPASSRRRRPGGTARGSAADERPQGNTARGSGRRDAATQHLVVLENAQQVQVIRRWAGGSGACGRKPGARTCCGATRCAPLLVAGAESGTMWTWAAMGSKWARSLARLGGPSRMRRRSPRTGRRGAHRPAGQRANAAPHRAAAGRAARDRDRLAAHQHDGAGDAGGDAARAPGVPRAARRPRADPLVAAPRRHLGRPRRHRRGVAFRRGAARRRLELGRPGAERLAGKRVRPNAGEPLLPRHAELGLLQPGALLGEEGPQRPASRCASPTAMSCARACQVSAGSRARQAAANSPTASRKNPGMPLGARNVCYQESV